MAFGWLLQTVWRLVFGVLVGVSTAAALWYLAL